MKVFIFNFVFAVTCLTFSAEAVLYQKPLSRSLLIQNSSDIAALFPQTVEEIVENFNFVKQDAATRIAQILSISPEERTFENTVLEFDRTAVYSQTYGSVLSMLQMVHPDQTIREKARETLATWTEHMIDLFETNQEIYRIFKEFQASHSDEILLNNERAYYLSETMSGFRRAGLELDAQGFDRMQQLQKQIASLTIKFSANIAQDHSTLRLKKEELLGLDDCFINSLEHDGEDYILVCDYPTRAQIMTNCLIESTRRNYYRTFYNRAFPKNVEILAELINSRDDLAHLLGNQSYAEFDIATEMAKTPDCVENFLKSLAFEANVKVKNDWKILLRELPESVSLTSDGRVKPWDVAFILNQYMKKHLNVDQDIIAEYFPLETTIQGLLNIYELFFDLKFQVVPGEHAYWDPSVQLIEVRQSKADQALIGYILTDLFPRENKYSHACCCSIIPPMSFDGSQTFGPALALVIANLSKPTATKPSLLKHSEVKTFFHEFGHAIHALLGKAEMPTKAAYNTKIDFVEMPSQLLEEWIWDREVLKTISRHYLTGETLPDTVIDKLLQNRGFGDSGHITTGSNGDNTATQILLSKLSLNLFKEGKNKNPIQIDRDIYDSSLQIIAYDPETHFFCSFGHLTNYGSKYYSYLWSKQLALKAFTYIKAHGGLFDPVMGKRYVSKIIGRGGSCDPNLLMTDFLQDEE